MRLFCALFAFLIPLAGSFLIPAARPFDETPYRTLVGFGVLYAAGGCVLSFFCERVKKAALFRSCFLAASGIALFVWDVLSTRTGVFPLPFFPGPAQIAEVAWNDRAELWRSALYSLRLFACGFVSGTALGVGTGILIGGYKEWRYWLFPLIRLCGVIPAAVWIPFGMAVFPSSFVAGAFMIAICSWFPVALSTANGFASIRRAHFEAARILGANGGFALRHVAIPAAVPAIFTGISAATGLSFCTLVVSEMVGAEAGLGWYINWAKGWSVYSKVYAAIIVMAMAFSAILALIGFARGRLLAWHEGR